MTNSIIRNILITAALLLVNISILVGYSHSSEYHHRNTQITNIINKYDTKGQALSAGLAAIDCDYTTRKWQGGIGMGFYDGIGAPVIGGCKKFDSVLFKATIGRENESTSGNIGLMVTFD